MDLFSALLVLACGVLVGVLSAMFGIGGGTVMVPLIHLVFGQPAAVSSGTSLFAILPTSISSMIARLHDGTINFKMGLAIGLAGACFSPLGAYAAKVLPGQIAMVLTACFILYSAFNMYRRVWRSRPGAVKPDKTKPARLAQAQGARLYGAAAIMGVFVGFISGYVGLGGGFIVVPLLQWIFGFTMKQSTGTSLVAVAIFAVPSFIAHAILGNVAWLIGLLLIAGSLFGSRLGAKIIQKVNDRMLTLLFATVLVISGIILAVTEFVG